MRKILGKRERAKGCPRRDFSIHDSQRMEEEKEVRTKGKILVVLLGVLAFGALIMAGGSSAQVRGVTDTEILIGQWGPQTGPAAPWGAVARGTGLFFKGLNDEGGINGKKIKCFLRDDSY